ncbi:MAG: diguanylate cyclase domain-containing protein [Aestuariibacter sp.]
MTEKLLYHILVVEDESTCSEIIKSQLQEQYLLTFASCKSEAMAVLQSETVHLLLLDIGLPDGNGLDILRDIKADQERYGDIAAIIITGLNDPGLEVEGLKLGANDYISKPIHAPVLSARVKLQVQLLRKTQLLAELARIDALTEIPNRRAFDDHLMRTWNHARRMSVPVSLAVIDIDFFKQFNDLYGHPEGDYCLKQVAQCMHSVIRRGSDHIARIGGEEFAALLFDCDLDHAQSVMQTLQEAVAKLAVQHEASAVGNIVTLSIGVCTASPEIDDQEFLLSAADRLLYQAKREGRNRVVAEYFHRMER